MGRCPRCGTDTGPMGGLCAMCNARERLLRDAEQRDAAKRSEQDREKKKNSSGYKAPSAPMDPAVAKVICIVLAIVLMCFVKHGDSKQIPTGKKLTKEEKKQIRLETLDNMD